MKQVKHWQEYASILLSVWLISCPLVLDFASHSLAMGNTVLVGVVLLAVAMGAVLVARAWEDWTETALGVWLAVSPLFLNYETQISAANALISGLLVATLALWAVQDQKLADDTSTATPV